VIGAVVILIVGWIITGWVGAAVRRASGKFGMMDDTLRPLAAAIARYVIIIFTLIAVLNQFGVQTASIIAVVGAAGLAIGLALQGALSNVAAGILILILRPFKVGDYVEAGGTAGTVKEIGLFGTELATPDNVFIAVPNAQITGGAVSNYSQHATRRIDMVVGIGYACSIDDAIAVLTKLAVDDARVLAETAPEATVRALGESSVDIGLRFWVNAGDYWPTLFDLNKAVKEALDAAGIEIPFPQRVVEIKKGD
jgi:small conductance mechanosensitive channel